MPMNNFGWTNEEDINLVELIKPNSHLYNILDPSRKNILARETTWQKIAQVISKPVEECKKRWRGLKDNYTRSKKIGTKCNIQEDLYDKLQFLDSYVVDSNDEEQGIMCKEEIQNMQHDDEQLREENVITDNQEYYEITLVDGGGTTINQETTPQVINFIPAAIQKRIPQKRGRKPGIKKIAPAPNIAPVKILPKPIVLNNHKIIKYMEEPKPTNQVNNKSNTIDKLIEKILKENTNEIDVFFRSMAASVKKLQPNLIPKVKMEVCNVIAKYEMQSFDKNGTNF